MASVAIRDVRKSFGNAEILHGVSIDIEDGEFVTAAVSDWFTIITAHA